ncbi:hypothetical protein AB9Q10_27345 [Streptomyces krungchingensis]|uniref:hypothetical protein n=1 Tax=Streptomyces krungchingensis TaxID=1565034 RepID=UPI003CEFD2EA
MLEKGGPLDEGLAGLHRAAESATAGPSHRVVAVDGKPLKGSAHSGAPGARHLLSAVPHAPAATIAQVELGSKTNETRHFRPLPAPLELAGAGIGTGLDNDAVEGEAIGESQDHQPSRVRLRRVRLRTEAINEAGSETAVLAMAFRLRLIELAQNRWCAVNAPSLVVPVSAVARFACGHLAATAPAVAV